MTTATERKLPVAVPGYTLIPRTTAELDQIAATLQRIHVRALATRAYCACSQIWECPARRWADSWSRQRSDNPFARLVRGRR